MGNRWEQAEVKELLDWVEARTEGQSVSESIREYVEASGTHRTVSALTNVYWRNQSTESVPQPVALTVKKNPLTEQLMEIVAAITDLIEENDSLRGKVAELEQVQQDYEIMSRILKQARETVIDHKRSTFRMDKNGNLERVE